MTAATQGDVGREATPVGPETRVLPRGQQGSRPLHHIAAVFGRTVWVGRIGGGMRMPCRSCFGGGGRQWSCGRSGNARAPCRRLSRHEERSDVLGVRMGNRGRYAHGVDAPADMMKYELQLGGRLRLHAGIHRVEEPGSNACPPADVESVRVEVIANSLVELARIELEAF